MVSRVGAGAKSLTISWWSTKERAHETLQTQRIPTCNSSSVPPGTTEPSPAVHLMISTRVFGSQREPQRVAQGEVRRRRTEPWVCQAIDRQPVKRAIEAGLICRPLRGLVRLSPMVSQGSAALHPGLLSRARFAGWICVVLRQKLRRRVSRTVRRLSILS
jgi:hypothetical protein